MKMLSLLLFGMLLMIPIVSSQVSIGEEEPKESFTGWLWNSIKEIWEYFVNGVVTDTSTTTPLIYEKNITYKDEVALNTEKTILDKSVSKYNNMLVVSQTQVPIIYEPPNSTTNILNFEFQTEDLITGKNISLKGSTRIPKGYTGEFIFNSSLKELVYFKGLETQPKITWEYATSNIINKVNYTDETIDGKLNISYVDEKTFNSFTSLKTQTDIDNIKATYLTREAYLDPDVSECGTISSAGVYTLTNSTIVNYPSTCMIINASNVVFDGQGYTIDGVSGWGYGIGLSFGGSYMNITLQNLTITDFENGISKESVSMESMFFRNLKISSFNSQFYINSIKKSFINNFTFSISMASDSLNNNFTNGTIHSLYFSSWTHNSINNRFYRNLFNGTKAITFTHSTNYLNHYYDNIFNTSGNQIIYVAGADNYYNTTLNCTSGKNVIGGDCIGGNYWGLTNGTGYSESCTDSDKNGICDVPYNVTSMTSCAGCSGRNIDSHPLTYTSGTPSDTEYPSFSNYWDNNGTVYYNNSNYFNVTVAKTNGTVILSINNTNYSMHNLTADVFNRTINLTSNGTFAYYFGAWGNGSSHNYNISLIRYYTVNNTPIPPSVDSEYPIFFNFKEFPTDPKEYNPNNIYYFNSSINSTNGTAGIEFNSINYSLSNISDVFNRSISSLTAGTYNYYYWAYGNGTSHFYNKTSIMTYTINKNNSYVLAISKTSPIEYPRATDFVGTGCPSPLTCSLNLTNGVYHAGTIYANYSTSGNDNYSALSIVDFITINQNSSYILALTVTKNLEYGQPTDFTGTLCPNELSCYLNISNGIYGAGIIYANYSSAGNTNYTTNSVINSTTIAKNSSYVLTISGTTPLEYGQSTDVSGGSCPSQLSCALDKSNGIYGVDVSPVIFNYSSNGNTNYSANSITKAITINKNNSLILSLSVTSPITYGTSSDFTGSGCPAQLTCSLNLTNQVFGAGVINANYSTAGNTNYSATSTIASLTINKASGSVYTYIDGDRADKTITNGTSVTLNTSLITGLGTIYLYVNDSLWDSDSQAITNTSQFDNAGTYVISGLYLGNANYTSAWENWTLTVNLDTPTPPSNASVISATTCKYKKFGYYNLRLPWFREVSCI